jgi:superfamily II DNA/RNA helicase
MCMPHAELITGKHEAKDENTDDVVAKTTMTATEAKLIHLFSTPENLNESVIECDASEKPLILLELLHTFMNQLTIVFTSSIESTHRLARLLQLCAMKPESKS